MNKRDIDSWLKTFEIKNTIKEEFLIYILKNSYLNIYKAKHGKRVKISKISKLSYQSLKSYKLFPILTSIDIEIINLLDHLKETFYLQNDIGYVIIKKLINTNRFFTEDLEPIKLKQKDIEIQFQKQQNFYTLSLNITNNLLNTTPVIEQEDNILYILNTQFNKYKILSLFEIEIQPNEVIKVYKHLKKFFKINLPEEFKLGTINTTPKPKITLQANKYLQLSFLYDSFEIKPYPFEEKTYKLSQNGEIEIIRDIEFEKSIIKQIENYGFKNLENTFIAENIETWQKFLDDIDTLKEKYIIEFIDFDIEFNDYENIEINTEKDWFSLSFEITISSKKYPLLPIIVPILKNIDNIEHIPEKITIEYEPHKYITIKTQEIKPILNTIFELLDKVKGNSLKINPFDAHLLDIDENIKWKGKKELLELSKKLKNFNGIKQITPPKNLKVKLRNYQQFGLNWLMFLREFNFGGILADDMGLGKTIQTLALLLKLKETNQLKSPILIIVPTSLLGNWKTEIEKFAPDLSFLAIYGNHRDKLFNDIEKFDIIFTTYNLIIKDFNNYKNYNFEYIILDEAQKIKNPNTKSTQTIKKLNSKYKLALSGTPIENNLTELWSIFSFLMPGFLGSLKTFKEVFAKPIEKENNYERKKLLHKKIQPFVLRRTKQEVLKELPKKVEIIKYAEFSEEEAKLYESIRIIMDKKVREAISQKGLEKSHILVLDALLKLRQICCHPQLLKINEAKKIKKSSKLELLMELLEDLLAENRKVLIFSQFTSMIDIIKENLDKKKISYSLLTGKTKNRDKAIAEFQSNKTNIFLISLKAGGIGLNLTQADSVIHYDPWWNIATQNQATDRAYRIGQDKNVFVYKLVVKNTIEEKILELQQKKANLADIFEKGEITSQNLLELLKG